MSEKMPKELKVLAHRLADFREKKNLTYQEIGDATGVDKSHIYRIESAAVYPSLKFLIRLAEFMQIPLYSLFIPAESMIHQDFSEKLSMHLTKNSISELENITEISTLRLLDFAQGVSYPNQEEYQKLAQALNVVEETDYHQVKFNMLASLLDDFGLQKSQVNNMLQYVKDRIK